MAALAPRGESAQSYWSLATEAELRLLLGDFGRAADLIKGIARRLGPFGSVDWEAVASTCRQIRRTCHCLNVDPALLEPLRPPMVIAYTGHMIGPRFSCNKEGKVVAIIRAQLAKENVGCGFGSLAGGADILFAEALLERGAELNIVLPFDRADFITHSVGPSGPAWPDRFERCLSRAHTVRFATNDSYLGDDAPYQYAAHMAMGRTVLRARLTDSPLALFAIWDGKDRASRKKRPVRRSISRFGTVWGTNHGSPRRTGVP